MSTIAPPAPRTPATTDELVGVDLVVRARVPDPAVVARALRACTDRVLPLGSVTARGGHHWSCTLRATGPIGLADIVALGARLHEAGLPLVELECRYARA